VYRIEIWKTQHKVLRISNYNVFVRNTTYSCILLRELIILKRV